MPAESQFSFGPEVTWDDSIIKPIDESVSASTTLQSDDHLVFPIVANIPYEAEYVIGYTGPSAADMKHQLQLSAGSETVAWRWHAGLGPTTQIAQTALVSNINTDIVNASSTVVAIFKMYVSIQGNADANVTFRWAQNASDAGALIVKAGSYVRWRKLVA
jgi:hypothetical protein